MLGSAERSVPEVGETTSAGEIRRSWPGTSRATSELLVSNRRLGFLSDVWRNRRHPVRLLRVLRSLCHNFAHVLPLSDKATARHQVRTLELLHKTPPVVYRGRRTKCRPLVTRCQRGASTQNSNTLCAADIATAWVELEAVWGKSQPRVGGAVDRIRTRLPMALVGLDSDNGSEFINRWLLDYCRRHAITFTRSRAYKKNDNAHVEQKNGAIVRHLIGYDRFASHAAYAQLGRVHTLARLHVNFFQPVERLVTKTRQGARVQRVYDRAQTPYQRLVAAGVLTPAQRQQLETLYQKLNPLQLRRDLDAALDRLWALAADPQRVQGDTQVATPSQKSSPGGS